MDEDKEKATSGDALVAAVFIGKERLHASST
jgi:hypothetical protein